MESHHVRMSKQQAQVIKRAAAREGLSTPAFMRRAALQDARRVLGDAEVAKMLGDA